MSMTQEEHRLVLQVLNAEKLAGYTREMARYEDAIKLARAALEAKRITQATYDRALEVTGKKMAATRANIEDLQKQTRNYQQNLIGLSYALNDFTSVQGGFQQQMIAIANNMPMLLAGFGGLGLALSAILPMLPAIVNSAKSFLGALGGEDAEKAKAALDAIGEKLADRKKQLEELDRLKTPAKDERKRRAEQLQGDLDADDPAAIVAAVEGAMPRAGLDAMAAERDRLVKRHQQLSKHAKAGNLLAVPAQKMVTAAINALDAKINQAITTRQLDAKEIVKKAMVDGDPQALAAIIDLVNARPHLFTAQQRGAFDAATPEAMAASEKVDADLEASIQRQKEGQARRAEKEAKRQKEIAEQGQIEAANHEAVKQAHDARDARARQRADQLAENTPIDEMAFLYAQQARARGGDFDPRTGKRTGRDPVEALGKDAARLAKRAEPGMSDDDAMTVGARVAKEAFAQVDQLRQQKQQMTQFVAENAQTTAALFGEIQQLQAMFGQAAAQQVRMRQQMIQNLRTQRVRTFEMLGGP